MWPRKGALGARDRPREKSTLPLARCIARPAGLLFSSFFDYIFTSRRSRQTTAVVVTVVKRSFLSLCAVDTVEIL